MVERDEGTRVRWTRVRWTTTTTTTTIEDDDAFEDDDDAFDRTRTDGRCARVHPPSSLIVHRHHNHHHRSRDRSIGATTHRHRHRHRHPRRRDATRSTTTSDVIGPIFSPSSFPRHHRSRASPPARTSPAPSSPASASPTSDNAIERSTHAIDGIGHRARERPRGRAVVDRCARVFHRVHIARADAPSFSPSVRSSDDENDDENDDDENDDAIHQHEGRTTGANERSTARPTDRAGVENTHTHTHGTKDTSNTVDRHRAHYKDTHDRSPSRYFGRVETLSPTRRDIFTRSFSR